MKKIKAAGYVRVSTPQQVKETTKLGTFKEKISLSVQRDAITHFCKSNDYDLKEIYSDEGISGGSLKNRFALQQCIQDGQAGKFNILVVYRLSRFGRNARELLQNYHALQEVGVELRSISEGIDFSTKYGKAFLGILAILAELENDIRRETMLDGRIAKAQGGAPTSGMLPIGRLWNDDTQEWELDQTVVDNVAYAAKEYLTGKSLYDVAQLCKARGFDTSPTTLRRTLVERCGTDWTVQFKDEQPITYKIPPLLSEKTIKRIHDQIEYNRVNLRSKTNKYLLKGYLFCKKCGGSCTGWSQVKKGILYEYYYHPSKKVSKCDAFTNVNMNEVDNSVLSTIFEYTMDWPAFEKAIAESMPDEKFINTLDTSIHNAKKKLKQVQKDIDKLGAAIIKGINIDTILKEEKRLYELRDNINKQLEGVQEQRNTLPNPEEFKKQAEEIRMKLFEQFERRERIKDMSFEEKRELLAWMFEGRDELGRKFGIYINAEGKYDNKYTDIHIHGRLTPFKADENIQLIEGDQSSSKDRHGALWIK